jgi:tripartite-type tricarboxylate transporter receptor subunit TctC
LGKRGLSINPQLMAARKTLPADDLRGLVVYMKANPGRTTLVNQLASALLAGQLLQQLIGVSVQFIPYRGAGPATTDLIAGQVDLMVSQASVVLPNIEAGTIKPLANLSPRRSAAIPTIPTVDIAAPEQQTPDGLAAFHKAEIEKWWPVLRAANVRAE